MRILLICNKSPYPSNEGGPMAMDAIIRGLLAAGHDITVLAASSHKHPAASDDIPDIIKDKLLFHSAPVDLHIRPFPALVCLLKGRSYHAARFLSGAFLSKLTILLKNNNYDIIQLESVFMGVYLPLIRQQVQVPVVLRAHNIEHQIWERLTLQEGNKIKRWYLGKLAQSLKKFEFQIVKSIDAIAAITEEDAGWFRQHTAAPVSVIPYSIEIPEDIENVPPIASSTVCHIGSMNWWPNIDGIRWLLKEVWPRVIRQEPQAQLFLAGKHMPDDLKTDEKSGVYVLGEVDDATAFLDQHAILVIPLHAGSGMRIKMVEGMLRRRAIVATSIAAEGIPAIDGEHYLRADTPEDFSKAILTFIKNPDFQTRIGGNAQLLVRKYFDRHRLSGILVDLYASLMGDEKK
ncbi:MAG: glycosyltransferase [Lentimicrobiaceae bacterium]|nr:glycosyltransferase [Lentimicrobiaceae bacterium]